MYHHFKGLMFYPIGYCVSSETLLSFKTFLLMLSDSQYLLTEYIVHHQYKNIHINGLTPLLDTYSCTWQASYTIYAYIQLAHLLYYMII